MNKPIYGAPEAETVFVMLEKGIAYTATHGNSDIEDLDPNGNPWGDF